MRRPGAPGGPRLKACNAMTPGGLHVDDIVTWGLVALFGGALLHGLLGALVGWLKGAEAGIMTGLLLFGLTGLGAAAWLASFVYLETEVVTLARSGCEPLPPEDGEARSQDLYRLPRDGMPPLKLLAPVRARPCPEHNEPPARLRVRRDELRASGAVFAMPEDDSQQAPAIIGVFAAFGGFGFLFGIIMLGGLLEQRRRARGLADRPPRQVPALLQTLSRSVSAAGIVLAVAGFGLAAFVDDTALSFALAFGGPAAFCAAQLLAGALRWRLDLSGGAGLLLGTLAFGAAAAVGFLVA